MATRAILSAQKKSPIVAVSSLVSAFDFVRLTEEAWRGTLEMGSPAFGIRRKWKLPPGKHAVQRVGARTFGGVVPSTEVRGARL